MSEDQSEKLAKTLVGIIGDVQCMCCSDEIYHMEDYYDIVDDEKIDPSDKNSIIFYNEEGEPTYRVTVKKI